MYNACKMFNPVSLRRREYGCGKHFLIVDVSEITPGEYEAIAMRSNGNDLDVLKTTDREAAVEAFERMCRELGTAEDRASLSPRMTELVEALRKASEVAIAVREADAEDGGTCNRDSPALDLPGMKPREVEVCARMVGLTVFDWRLFKHRLWVFGVPGPSGQGNLRSRMAEAMTRSLKESGFDATEYCQMD